MPLPFRHKVFKPESTAPVPLLDTASGAIVALFPGSRAGRRNKSLVCVRFLGTPLHYINVMDRFSLPTVYVYTCNNFLRDLVGNSTHSWVIGYDNSEEEG